MEYVHGHKHGVMNEMIFVLAKMQKGFVGRSLHCNEQLGL